MERLNCYMCQQLVSGGLNGLVRHFISIHGLTINRGVGNAGFKCGQSGCQRTFIHFYTLRRHIRNYHLHERNTELEQEREREGLHNDNNNDEDFDLQKLVIRMIAKFQCNGSMTGHLLTQILDECEKLLLTVRDFVKKKVRKIFEDNNMLHDDVSKDVLQVLEFDSPFEQMRTLDEQINALKKHCGYIEPIEILLGYRLDSKLDSKTATYIPKMIMETCQYIPIIDSLKLVLSNEDVRQAILSERKSIDDNILASFLDGQHATIHPFLLQHKHALRIQLYYDELEIVNPLGSKTGVHKLGAFYYTIQNLPPHINSELSSIHVLLLCCDSDVKKYGFKKILAPFLQDLVKLEGDKGIPIEIGPHQFILRGFLAAFVGDGLSVHDVYNLLGPSANKFCRMCLYRVYCIEYCAEPIYMLILLKQHNQELKRFLMNILLS
nr:PREDICTED: uncharacterized protein LOC105670111 [Linepithema humile]